MREENIQPLTYEWSMHVPVFRNKLIWKQLGLAIGIPFGLMLLILFIATGFSQAAFYTLGIVAALFLLTWIFLIIIYRGKYGMGFILNKKGILTYVLPEQNKKNKIVNGITAVAGLLTGRPTITGAGMLASSRQKVFIKWGNIRKVKYDPRHKTILIKGTFAESTALFCLKENYEQVADYVKTQMHHI